MSLTLSDSVTIRLSVDLQRNHEQRLYPPLGCDRAFMKGVMGHAVGREI